MSKMTWVMGPLPEELAIVKWGLRSSEVCAEKVRNFFLNINPSFQARLKTWRGLSFLFFYTYIC